MAAQLTSAINRQYEIARRGRGDSLPAVKVWSVNVGRGLAGRVDGKVAPSFARYG